MIVTELYNGQGLGNQLWSYVVIRTIALNKGFDFGIINPDKFKGNKFLELDFGTEIKGGTGPEGGPPKTLPLGISNYYVEKDTWYEKYSCDISDYDCGLLSIADNTKIDGIFQSENYILHRKNDIKDWLRVKKEYECYDFCHDDICILNIRGGEYKGNHELILKKKYWTDAISNMLRINNKLKFVIITDDVKYSQQLLPEYQSYHFDVGKDYSVVKNARYLILSNSSFAFFPAWISDTVRYIIAPKYWARHNVSDGFWACAFNLYRGWMWQDTNGNLSTFDECQKEYNKYKIEHNLDKLGSRQKLEPNSYSQRFFLNGLSFVAACKKRLMD